MLSQNFYVTQKFSCVSKVVINYIHLMIIFAFSCSDIPRVMSRPSCVCEPLEATFAVRSPAAVRWQGGSGLRAAGRDLL